MMHGWGYGMRGFFGGGTIMMGIFWVIVIGIVVYLIKNSNNHTPIHNYHQDTKTEDEPLEIAKKRYARGEISKEEYQEIKEELIKN